MRNLALLLLLAVTASMIFTYDPSVLAQETPETPPGNMTEAETSEEETGEEMSEEAMEEETMEDTMEEETMEDTMEEEVMEEDVDSPLEQMISGVDPHETQCKSGQKLVFKASNWRPVCVNESSFDILVLRGWIASHDPTHEDLIKMHDDYMAAHQQEVEEEVEEEMEEEVEEEMEDETEEEVEEETEEETTDDTETETEGETQPQNYTAKLSESMEMGAN